MQSKIRCSFSSKKTFLPNSIPNSFQLQFSSFLEKAQGTSMFFFCLGLYMHIKFILYKLLFISYKHLSDARGAGSCDHPQLTGEEHDSQTGGVSNLDPCDGKAFTTSLMQCDSLAY